MGAEDHCISRLDRHYALEQHGRRRIRDRGEGEQNADRFGHLQDVPLRNVTNHPHRALVFNVVVNEFAGHHVLDDLIFHYSKPGLFHGETRQVLRLLEPGQDHRFDDAVDIFLGELRKHRGSNPGLTDQRFQVRDAFCARAFGGQWKLGRLLTFSGYHHYLPRMLRG